MPSKYLFLQSILLFYLILPLTTAAQPQMVEKVLQQLDQEKREDIRIDTLVAFFNLTADANPLLTLQNQEAVLAYTRRQKNTALEALTLSHIGYCFRSFGNTEKSFEYALKGDDLALRSGNEKTIVNTKMILAFCFKDVGNTAKSIALLKSAQARADVLHYDIGNSRIYENLAELYIPLNIDSALYYAQQDYALAKRMNYTTDLPYVFMHLATIWGKLGNAALADNYFNLAEHAARAAHSAKILNWIFTSKARYFEAQQQPDSAIFYAKQAIAAVQNTAFDNYKLQPAGLLRSLYSGQNVDSAFKYSEINRMVQDSVLHVGKVQRTQLLAFENDLKEQELLAEKARLEQVRQEEIQYILLALGILGFLLIFLLLSHSIIANTKVIAFVGAIALLIIFEFLNLLLHPFLERLTHHSPVLLLLSMVSIAALLVPLHHKMEHWAIHKLITKNQRLRQAAKSKETAVPPTGTMGSKTDADTPPARF